MWYFNPDTEIVCEDFELTKKTKKRISRKKLMQIAHDNKKTIFMKLALNPNLTLQEYLREFYYVVPFKLLTSLPPEINKAISLFCWKRFNIKDEHVFLGSYWNMAQCEKIASRLNLKQNGDIWSCTNDEYLMVMSYFDNNFYLYVCKSKEVYQRRLYQEQELMSHFSIRKEWHNK